MASNRDPQKDYRINRRGRKVTSSADRSKRAKKASAPKPTSSSTRSRGRGTGSKRLTSASDRVNKKPITGGPRGAQGPRTAPQQGPSRPVKGLIGSRGASTSKPPVSKVVKGPGRFADKPQVKANVKALKSSPLKYLKSGKAAAAITLAGEAFGAAKATADQGRISRENRSAPAKALKKKLPKVKMPKVDNTKPTAAQSFDKAFAKARKEGKKTFSWRGKLYNTKLK